MQVALTSSIDPIKAGKQAIFTFSFSKDGKPLVTDNGGHIVDVRGLGITNPLQMEGEVNQWPGVVTVGIFAQQKAQICLLGSAEGVKMLKF